MIQNIDLEELDSKARLGAFSTLDMAVLVPEVQRLRPGQVYLEVGVDKGKSLSVARMVADKHVKVFGVDICENPKVPDTVFMGVGSNEASDIWFVNNLPLINVLFVDGDHTLYGCAKDIDNWYRHMARDGVMLFHDCDDTSPGVVKAVKNFVSRYNLKDVYYDPNPRCSMARVRLG